MLFVEPSFVLLFLPIAFFLHESLRRLTSQVWLLIVASLVFYSVWNPWLVLLLCTSIATNYAIAVAIPRFRGGHIFWIGVLLNLTPLFYFKYSGFIAQSAGLPFEVGLFGEGLGTLLPLGISFFTFQQIAFIADVRFKGVDPPPWNRYLLFICFFPQLIAGPILHHQEFIPQINASRERTALFIVGIAYFAIGFAKKVFLADELGAFVDPLFDAPHHDFESALTATLGYTFQLYFDFSGYSDMAIGLGAIFGYRLPWNFDSPYKSGSITEFWRRWHITLSTWLRDYVYIPLGGNRGGEVRTYLNLLTTMLIGGLWHGAAWSFVAWGGAHGLLLALERFARAALPRLRLGWLSWLPTFVAVSLLWVLFRAESFSGAMSVYRGFLSWTTPELTDHLGLIIVAAIVCVAPSSHAIAKRIEAWARSRPSIDMRKLVAKYAAYWLIAYSSCILLVLAFYTSGLDRYVYRFLATPDTRGTIQNEDGDFRSNLYSQRIFQHNGPKVLIVGSSFSKDMGMFEFEHGDETYRSSSLGIGGNSIINGLRTAFAVLGIKDVRTIILSVSPLNFGPLSFSAAFPGECLQSIERIVPGPPVKELGSCEPIQLGQFHYATLLAMDIGAPEFFQFQNFAFQLRYAFLREPLSVQRIELGGKSDFVLQMNLRLRAAQSTGELPPNLENGNNGRFRWQERRTNEAFSLNAPTYQAFAALKREADQRGIRLVVYETPTPRHSDAPQIYPAGYYERYKTGLASMLEELSIPFLDLGDMLPWRRTTMADFVHPTLQLRPEIHRLILEAEFVHPDAITDVLEWRR